MPANAKRRARRMRAGITKSPSILYPRISCAGPDTNISLHLKPQGAGVLTWNGTPVPGGRWRGSAKDTISWRELMRLVDTYLLSAETVRATHGR